MDNPIDAFINAIVDGLKKHEGFKEFIKEHSGNNFNDIDFCDLLRSNSYEVNEVALEDFDLDNYSSTITDIIDSHIDDEFMSNRIKGLEWEIQVK
jgi:hypothetical protein